MATAIPVINNELETDVSTEAPAKASFWQRAKSRVVDIAKRVASPIAAASRTTAKAVKTAAVKTASTVKRAALKVGSSTKRAAKAVAAKFRRSGVPSEGRLWRARRATDKVATRVVTWLHDTWHRVLRPFIRLRVVAYGIVFGVVALVVAPVTTLLVVAAVGAALVGLSYVVEWLEGSSSRAARVALKAIEVLGQLVVGLVYAATVAVTLALCTYLPFLIAEVLELVLRYFDVKSAVFISSMAYFLLAGQFALFAFFGILAYAAWRPTATLTRADQARSWGKAWRAIRSVDTQTVESKGNRKTRFEAEMDKTREEPKVVDAVVVESPRRVKLPKCSACGVDDGGMRFGLRGHHDLCGGCFNQLDTEEALEAARTGRLNKAGLARLRKLGVKVPKAVETAVSAQLMNRRRELTLDEINQLSAMVNSRDDIARIYWAETAWWHDAAGKPRTREWLGFVAGNTVVSVEYRHEKERRGFEAWLLGAQESDDRKVGLFHTLSGAQDALGDALTDQAAVVGGMLDALEAETPAPVETADVLAFVEAKTFSSPEEHVSHVRETEGEAAAVALEERYLQEMIAAEKSS